MTTHQSCMWTLAENGQPSSPIRCWRNRFLYSLGYWSVSYHSTLDRLHILSLDGLPQQPLSPCSTQSECASRYWMCLEPKGAERQLLSICSPAGSGTPSLLAMMRLQQSLLRFRSWELQTASQSHFLSSGQPTAPESLGTYYLATMWVMMHVAMQTRPPLHTHYLRLLWLTVKTVWPIQQLVSALLRLICTLRN